ncbi:hypothetical protein I6A84_43655 [Frankia sp. CNm7]|uniref:Uncharacterized protein n=1 Tax=Frankia nepalensis TaxID=1836974 RepID=A0A937USR3_9ACTN|nr:hypothetical protein [Frankia nepalensis]MBL7498404.1 hypothetical protein [Frankia nepalensis]MBL7512048.1 hypothetical protein [Frankia nepalensis]MBL7524760.1 hypothetical protein [Frankia nepalensis]MBL7632383.1 hypothetical protein [Frankia nepalensis]
MTPQLTTTVPAQTTAPGQATGRPALPLPLQRGSHPAPSPRPHLPEPAAPAGPGAGYLPPWPVRALVALLGWTAAFAVLVPLRIVYEVVRLVAVVTLRLRRGARPASG